MIQKSNPFLYSVMDNAVFRTPRRSQTTKNHITHLFYISFANFNVQHATYILTKYDNILQKYDISSYSIDIFFTLCYN